MSIQHKIDFALQPTNTTCGYTALSMLLSFYDKKVSTEELTASVEQPTDKDGHPVGSITTELVQWCLNQGFKSHLYSFDCQMLDLSWNKLTQEDLKTKINDFSGSRNVLGLGRDYGQRYMDGYAAMITLGGKLAVLPHVTSELIDTLLATGPVYANVCSDVMDNIGRTETVGLRQFQEDDKDGSLHTHSIVVYGKNEDGDYLVADPWRGPRTLSAETLLCSITMAQIECDNMIFQLQT